MELTEEQWRWVIIAGIGLMAVYSFLSRRAAARERARKVDAIAAAFGAQAERVDDVRFAIELELDDRPLTIRYGAWINSTGPPRKLPQWRLECSIPLRRVPDIYNFAFRPKRDGSYLMLNHGFEPAQGALEGPVHEAVSSWAKAAGPGFRLEVEEGRLRAHTERLPDAATVHETVKLQLAVAREIELALGR